MLDFPDAIYLYLCSIAAIAGGTFYFAQKKGRAPFPAAFLAALCALPGIVAGLIVLAIYASLPPKHRYCPNCGERNIHFLTRCRHCDTPL